MVFLNRLTYALKLPLTEVALLPLGEPQRGEAVTFAPPQDGTHLIRRMAAVPGDRLEMRNEVLSING